MNIYNMSFASDYAEVTAWGIQFRGCLFTCSIAIRERWFEFAQLLGGWSVKVYFNPSNTNTIFLRIDDEMERCYSVNSQIFVGSKLERYFQTIQKLKRIRKN